MDFHLSEQQQMFRDSVAAFARRGPLSSERTRVRAERLRACHMNMYEA
jgi:hypothetical protein